MILWVYAAYFSPAIRHLSSISQTDIMDEDNDLHNTNDSETHIFITFQREGFVKYIGETIDDTFGISLEISSSSSH